MQDLDVMQTTSSLGATIDKSKEMQAETVCQNSQCRGRSKAVKVCHHSDCRDANENRPFLLCEDCCVEIHSRRSRTGHLCFDIPKRRGQLPLNFCTSDKKERDNSNAKRTHSEGNGIMNSKPHHQAVFSSKTECCDTIGRYQTSDRLSDDHLMVNGIDKHEEKNDCDSSGIDGHSDEQNGHHVDDHENSNVPHYCNNLTDYCNHQNDKHVEGTYGKDLCRELTIESHKHSNYHRSYSSQDPICNMDLSVPQKDHDQSSEELSDHSRDGHEGQKNETIDKHLSDDCCVDDRLDQRSDSDRCADEDQTGPCSNNDQSGEQNCGEGVLKMDAQRFGDTSQDCDEDDTENESFFSNQRLKRKKAMKIKKAKLDESFVKQPSSPRNDDIQKWKLVVEFYQKNKSLNNEVRTNGFIKSPTDSTTKATPDDSIGSTVDAKDTETLLTFNGTDIGRQQAPSSYTVIRKCDTQTENKVAENDLRSDELTEYSGNSLNWPSKPKTLRENSRNHHPCNRQNIFLQDDARKKPFGTRILGSSKMNGEFFRKFSLTSEYFTLRFGADEQMVVAPKGLPLSRAISSLISERWGLMLDQCDIFLNSSNSALPLSSDCYLLANNTLWLKVKQNKMKNRAHHSPLPSDVHCVSPVSPETSDRNKQIWNVRTSKKNISPEDCLSADAISSYSTLSQGDLQKLRNAKGPSKFQSFFQFAKIQDKQEQLVELLNGYSNNGLPKMPDLLSLGRPQYDPSIFYLEQHWKDIVKNQRMLTKPQRDQQEALWELLATEVEYIRKLRVVTDLFMCCLFNLQNEQLLNEIEADKLFSNIDDVYFATCHFWNVHMSQVLQHARETNEPLNASLLKAGFLVFDKIFEPYTKYCLEQDTCQEYIRSKTKENELFRLYIQWGQSQKQCRLLRLQDIMCGPWQRLMRYRLLLKEILKYTEQIENPTPEDQINDLENMIEQVEKFVARVNVAMRHREESQQMSKLTSRIESYEVVEAPNEECAKLLDKFCKLDLISSIPGCGPREMRMLILEGSLKLKDAFSKTDVYCFLFTDLFLITKPTTKRNGDKVKVIKPPMRLDKIVVHSLKDPASFMILYLNEYHVAQAIYTFHGDSRLWTESLRKAQNDYKDKRYQHFIRSDHLFSDIHGNDINDEDSSAFTESPPPVAEFLQDNDSLSRSNSRSSTGTYLPNCSSELSLLSSLDLSKDLRDDSSLNSSLSTRWQSINKDSSLLSTNPRLNNSCDQLALTGKDSYTHVSAPRKLHLSTSFSGSSSKIMKIDGRQSTKEEKMKPVHANLRHYSDCDGKKLEKDSSVQKRLSWNFDTVGPRLTVKEPSYKNLNLAFRSRLSAVNNSHHHPLPHADMSVGKRPIGLSTEHGKTSDVDRLEESPPRTSSPVFKNDNDCDSSVNLSHIRQSASMPAFPKLENAIMDLILENKNNESDWPSKAFVLEDCTLGATDV